MTLRYYEDEMRYLQEAARVFAQIHPEHGAYLNIDSLTDRDPYVERLFEGFAFLTARIREHIDDEIPQITESLFRVLHPHFVKTIPSAAILEFTPRPGMLQQTTEFEAGTEVRSAPEGPESTVCRFTTTWPVSLHPFKLIDARLDWPSARSSRLSMRFQVDRGIDPGKIKLDRLRLYFLAEPSKAATMHLFFCRHVGAVRIKHEDGTINLGGQPFVRPVGFEADEGLLPSSAYSFSGYRLLLEYFAFRPKFWFADIVSIDDAGFSPGAGTFEIEIDFDRAFPEDRSFSAENLRLYCTPILNLFDADAEPMLVDHRRAEYRVVADVKRPRAMAVYDIRTVTGMEQTTGKRHEYAPYQAFLPGKAGERFYTETTRPGPTDRREYYVSLGSRNGAASALQSETLTLEVRCTNGPLPREALHEGSINQPAPGFMNVATFRNLTSPSVELHPPINEQRAFLWKLVSHMAYNHMSLASRESLTGLLELYDWSGLEANRRRRDGIRDVKWKPHEILHRGGILRGAEVTVDIQDGHFPDEGDVNLFGTVLSTFFSMYATINSFIHLTITTVPSGKTYHWKPLRGDRSPL